MHETVFATSLLKIALEAAKEHETPEQRLRVLEIGLDVGVLACLEPQTLTGCFELLAEGTAAEGARLNIRRIPMRGRCPDCGSESEAFKPAAACPACSGREISWQGGNEMEISSIRVEPLESEKRHEP